MCMFILLFDSEFFQSCRLNTFYSGGHPPAGSVSGPAPSPSATAPCWAAAGPVCSGSGSAGTGPGVGEGTVLLANAHRARGKQ